MDSFITLEEFQVLFRSLTIEEDKTFDLKASIVSDAIRQEAKNVGKDIDEMLENNEIYPGVLKEITSTVLSRWMTQPTDFPTIDSSTDNYDSSVTWYNSSNMGISVLKKELKRLGLLRQKVMFFKKEE